MINCRHNIITETSVLSCIFFLSDFQNLIKNEVSYYRVFFVFFFRNMEDIRKSILRPGKHTGLSHQCDKYKKKSRFQANFPLVCTSPSNEDLYEIYIFSKLMVDDERIDVQIELFLTFVDDQ